MVGGERLSGLTETDLRVLKAACEFGLGQGHLTVINARELHARPELRELPADELLASAQVLEEGGYFDRPARWGPGLEFGINVSTYGFEQYLQRYLPDAPTLVRRLKAEIVRLGEGNARALSRSVGCPQLVAAQVLHGLAARKQLRVILMNDKLNPYFHEPSVSLQREVRGS